MSGQAEIVGNLWWSKSVWVIGGLTGLAHCGLTVWSEEKYNIQRNIQQQLKLRELLNCVAFESPKPYVTDTHESPIVVYLSIIGSCLYNLQQLHPLHFQSPPKLSPQNHILKHPLPFVPRRLPCCLELLLLSHCLEPASSTPPHQSKSSRNGLFSLFSLCCELPGNLRHNVHVAVFLLVSYCSGPSRWTLQGLVDSDFFTGFVLFRFF